MVLTFRKIIETQTSTEKVGNKINISQNKSRIPNGNNRRPNNCITEKYLQNDKHVEKRKKIVPVNRNYAVITAFGKKILIVGGSHLKKIKGNKLNNSISKAKCIGAMIQDLKYYAT